MVFQWRWSFDEEYKEALSWFVKITALVYVPYILKSSIGAYAPVNNLQLVHDLLKFREVSA